MVQTEKEQSNQAEGLSILIPVHNEALCIGSLLSAISQLLTEQMHLVPAEIIIIDDASEDGSDLIIRMFADSCEHPVRVLKNPERIGSGASRKRGCAHAKHTWLAWIDGDMTYTADDILSLWKGRDGHDLLIGSRDCDFGKLAWLRKGIKAAICKLCSILWDRRIPDVNSGLRLIRRDCLDQWIHELPDGFSCTTTSTLAALNHGQRVEFVPVAYKGRPSGSCSKFHPAKDTFRLCRTLWRQWLRKPQAGKRLVADETTPLASAKTRWFLRSASGFWGALAIAVLAAHTGVFGTTTALALLLAFVFALVATWCLLTESIARRIPPGRLSGRRSRFYTVIAILLVPLALVSAQLSRPSENILGASDTGAYTAAAHTIARTGAYPMEVGWPKTVDPVLKNWWQQEYPVEGQRREGPIPRLWSHSVGFMFLDQSAREGAVAIPFPIGFPTGLAAATHAGGVAAWLHVNMALHLFASGLFGLFLFRWLGATAGVVGVILFTLCPLLVLGGNQLFAEPLLLCCWLTALNAWAWRKHMEIQAGLTMGLATGCALLIKVDGLAMMLFLPIIALGFRRNQSFTLSFAGAFAPVFLLAVLPTLQSSGAYWVHTLSAWVSGIPLSETAALSGVLLLISIFGAWKWQGTLTTAYANHRSLICVFLGLSIVSLCAYFYWVRPNPATPDLFYFSGAGREIRSYREESFLRLSWYLGGFGLWLGILGSTGLLLYSRRPCHCAFIMIGLAVLFAFAYDVRCEPRQPYCMRRFTVYAIPLLIAGMAAAPTVLARWHSSLRLPAILAVLGFVGGSFYSESVRLLEHSELPGLHSQLESIAATLPDDEVVLIRERLPFSDMATPLRFFWNKNIFQVYPEKNNPAYSEAMQEFAKNYANESKSIHVLSLSPRDTLHLENMNPTVVASFRLETSRLKNTYLVPPNEAETISQKWYLLRLGPATAR